MADSNILSDFGINILEQEIDDVIFQTNEFLCDATFTGSQGPFWWLLVVAVTNSPKHDFNRCKSATCRFLLRAGGFLGDSLGVGVSQGIGVVAHIAVSAALVGKKTVVCRSSVFLGKQ